MAAKTKCTDLSVRKLTPKDAWAYKQIAFGEDLFRYCNFFVASTLEEAEKRIQQNNTNYQTLYGLFTKSNRLVAVFLLSADDAENAVIVHYFVGERYRGNGYACAGLKLLSGELEYNTFRFEVRKKNESCIRVMEKLGAEFERSDKRHFYYAYYC